MRGAKGQHAGLDWVPDTTDRLGTHSAVESDQWQAELATKFHLDAELVLSSTVGRLSRQLLDDQSIFERHPYTSGEHREWWIERFRQRVAKLRDAGVDVGAYDPDDDGD